MGTVATIADLAEERKFLAPAVTLVGGVVALREKLNWFETRPLFGQRVVVTRTRTQASKFAERLKDLGAAVLEIPTIKIVPPSRYEAMTEAIIGIGTYDWLVFTSPNGVTHFFEYFFKAYDDMRAIGNVRIAAVGPATAAALNALHLHVDIVPEKYVASEIAAAIKAYESPENLKFLLVRAEVANLELPGQLEDMGGIVDDIAVYQTVPETEDRNGAAQSLTEEGADWLTFTSGSTVEHFHARFDLPTMRERHPAMRVASIGPETTRALAALGVVPEVEAREHTIDGLVQALIKQRPPNAPIPRC